MDKPLQEVYRGVQILTKNCHLLQIFKVFLLKTNP